MKAEGKVFVVLMCITTGFSAIWKVTNTFLEMNLAENKRSCENCLTEEHPWFVQRFQKSIAPLLTGQYNLSEDDFNWWKKLQNESRDLNYFRQTTDKLFELFPSKPPVTEPSWDRCRTCAVVGNSENLRRSHYGKLIDQHNSVFRINFGRTEGFEKDVGTKTTHRVMYPESATNLTDSTHMVFFAFKILDLEWLIAASTKGFYGWPDVATQISANKNLVSVANPAFMKYVHESWLQKRGQYPSTGFMAVILALHICDEVSVFGFGADSDGNWSHYWEELEDKHLRTGPHPGSVEYDVHEELDKQGKITFYKGGSNSPLSHLNARFINAI